MALLAAVTALIAGGHSDACTRPYCERRRHVVAPYEQKLERMAWCESRRRWHIATGNGFYGGLQFDYSTWRSVGGHGFPHEQKPLNQMYRAVLLIRRAGYVPWPVCGRA
jgi:hypothetical protein